jgi:VWFA-related protein
LVSWRTLRALATWQYAPLVIAASLAALVVPLAAVQETTFKAGTRTVAVYATVTDQTGRLVPDLTRDNFEVEDNSKRQALTLFANDIQPITIVMLLDRSTSMRENFRLVEEAAEAFVADMRPDDRARIGSFSNRIEIDPRDFTSDHDEMIRILKNDLQEEGPTPLWNAVNVGITALLHEKGRRVVLVFTDGVDQPLNFSSMNSSLKSVTKRAEEEDVMIYAIGFAGQNRPYHAGFGGPFGGYGGRGGHGGRGGWGGGWGGPVFGGGRAAPEKPDEGLPRIAKATGGGYFELTSADDLAATFRRVADELHHQYVLGFTPGMLDGKLHKLDVHVTGQPASMTARARASYLAAPDEQ